MTSTDGKKVVSGLNLKRRGYEECPNILEGLEMCRVQIEKDLPAPVAKQTTNMNVEEINSSELDWAGKFNAIRIKLK